MPVLVQNDAGAAEILSGKVRYGHGAAHLRAIDGSLATGTTIQPQNGA